MFATPPYDDRRRYAGGPAGQPPAGQMAPEHYFTDGVLTRRVFAWMIDVAILGVIGSAAWVALFVFGLFTFGLGLPLMLLLPAIPVVYGWLFVASPLSATPGQAMMGLTVRRDVDLGPPSGGQALGTTLLFYLTMATTLGMVWFAVALLTRRRRTLHDIFSGTVVVHRRALTAPASDWNMRMGDWPSA